MKEIKFEELKIDTYQMFAKNWPLLTAGNQKKGYNTMTISWGHLGSLWGHNMPTVIVYVRPQRYTKKFVDENEYFTLSILDENNLIYINGMQPIENIFGEVIEKIEEFRKNNERRF